MNMLPFSINTDKNIFCHVLETHFPNRLFWVIRIFLWEVAITATEVWMVVTRGRIHWTELGWSLSVQLSQQQRKYCQSHFTDWKVKFRLSILLKFAKASVLPLWVLHPFQPLNATTVPVSYYKSFIHLFDSSEYCNITRFTTEGNSWG